MITLIFGLIAIICFVYFLFSAPEEDGRLLEGRRKAERGLIALGMALGLVLVLGTTAVYEVISETQREKLVAHPNHQPSQLPDTMPSCCDFKSLEENRMIEI